MKLKKLLRKSISAAMTAALVITLIFPNMNVSMFQNSVRADASNSMSLGLGSIGIGSDAPEAANLPRYSAKNKYRFTTQNYDDNNQAIDTNDWASSWLWDLKGNRGEDNDSLSGTAYALPLAFLIKKDGLRVSKPSMTAVGNNLNALMIQENDSFCDFMFAPEWNCANEAVDSVSDWSYQAVTTNPENASQSMKITMTQGSPFAFIEMQNTNTVTLTKLRETFPSAVVSESADMIVFRSNDKVNEGNGYTKSLFQYYALYLPAGASVEKLGTADSTGNDKIGKMKITLPADRFYLTFAWVYESGSEDDAAALAAAGQYKAYAYNFITDTRADYTYDESQSVLTTTYGYTVSKKQESTADGTIMGILPHQYKYMSGVSYLSNTAITLRGEMKFIAGSSYQTKMPFKGILPYMPALPDDDSEGKAEIKSYVDEFMNTYMQGSGSWTLSSDEGNETYYHGKKLNRAAQLAAAAFAAGDETSAQRLISALEANLETWFTYQGAGDTNYFTYLGEGVGALLGFPTSFNAVDQFNDHHFHYGYFIESAALAGLWDPEWLDGYKDVVRQLIFDIACPYRSEEECVSDCGNAYPYLRSFAPYEGHSWASGYEDEICGNNQESTSEAINAWAGIILFGELTGDTKIRDLGIYLYTTEAAAADCYWFDTDDTVYSAQSEKYEPPMASMVWGGKVDYSTWFGLQYTQGIQIIPMQSWSFYLLDGGADYIKKYYAYDKEGEWAQGGSTGEWNDIWAAYYALADPTEAMNSVWTREAVNDGEAKAHTYHYIRTLMDYGTPDRKYTSDSVLSAVFNNGGAHTFTVYNPTAAVKKVTFRDSTGQATYVSAAPRAMTVFNSTDAGKASYTIEYYAKNLNDDGYTLIQSDIRYSEQGSEVTAQPKEFTGYEFDGVNAGNVLSGNVGDGETLTLKLYYSRQKYTLNYQLNEGTKANPDLYPSGYTYGESHTLDTPVREDYDFYGWYTDETFEHPIESIDPKTNGNLTLYAKWVSSGTIMINPDVYLSFDDNMSGTFVINGDMQYDSVNVLYRVTDTEEEARELAESRAEEGFVQYGMTKTSSGWTFNTDFIQSKDKYIVFYFIRYNANGGYKSEYGYGRISNESTGKPTETPTEQQTEEPTETPTEKPTETPTEKPTEAPTEKPTEAPDVKPDTKVSLEVNGYQISSTVTDGYGNTGGYRTIYTVKDPEDEIKSVGLIQAPVSGVTAEDMVIGSGNDKVKSFEATDTGRLDVTFEANEHAASYAMTVMFMNQMSRNYINAGFYVRVYAELKDGGYAYSDLKSFSVFNIAEYLYTNHCMNGKDAHDYLYYNILRVADPRYKETDFDWNQSIVQPDEMS